MFRRFQKRESDDRLSVQIWTCRPLVVLDSDGDILFSGDAKVEFEPSGASTPLGLACVIEPDSARNWQLILLSRQVLSTDFRLGERDGLILSGEDAEGNGMRWLVGGAAIDRLARKAPTDAIDPGEARTELWDEVDLVVTHAEDGEVYRSETILICTHPASESGSMHLTARTPTADGWYPELWVESQTTSGDLVVLLGCDSDENPFTWELSS